MSDYTALREQLNDLDGEVSDQECARFLTAATGVVEGYLRRDLAQDFGEDIPAPIQQTILATAVYLFENRGVDAENAFDQGTFFTALLAPYRVFG